MNIIEKVIDFIFGYDLLHDYIDKDFERNYDPNISFDDIMKKYHEEEAN